ncbi:Cysteine desulfurase [Methylorubrum populi]
MNAERPPFPGYRDNIFLDHHATTPLDPRVLAAMMPYLSERFGNPHSVGYARAEAARAAVEHARASVASLIGAAPADVIFTSGATEACTIAIRGLLARPGKSRGLRLAISAIEHACVRGTARALDGTTIIELPVDGDGIVDLEAAGQAVDDKTSLVSVMMANNEIGTIQPVAEIASLCRLHGSLFHTDAAQAVGKLPIDVAAMGIDLLSLSGHKLYGPQGIGALYCHPGVRGRLRPTAYGGGQEGGLRPGTLPLALCVGLGEACRIAAAEMEAEATRVAALRDRLLSGLRASVPGLAVNGCLDRRLPGNLNLSLPGLDGDALVHALGDVAVSTGSACASGALEPSHVLAALGLETSRAESAIRIGIGRFTTAAEIDRAVDRIVVTMHALTA